MSNTGEAIVATQCHMLLEKRNFIGVTILVKMNKQLGKDWPKLEQAKAICDVIIAAEKRLSNGFMDYYGMIRVTRLGEVVLDDFMRLMKLLDGRFNVFPCSQEAAHFALLAWSFLSKPRMKARYDLAISASLSTGLSHEAHVAAKGTGRGRGGRIGGGVIASEGGFGGQGHGKGSGGFGGFGSGRGIRLDGGGGGFYGGRCAIGDGGFGGVDKGKQKVEPILRICPYCYSLSERETEKEKPCFRCKSDSKGFHGTTEMVPVSPAEKGEEMLQSGFLKDSSFINKEQSLNENVGHGTENVIVVISDDDSDEDQETITMAQTAKICRVNGKRVKLIPLKKKK